MKFLRDPLWQFIGAVVGLAGIFAAVYLRDRPVTALRVDILSNSPVVSVDSGVSSDVTVTYRNQQVRSLSLILLRLTNTGNQPIKATDYSAPLAIMIGDSAGIGEYVVQEVDPSDLKLTLSLAAPNVLELAPALLNPGDRAILRLLAFNNDSTLAITARIAAVRRLDIRTAAATDSDSRTKSPWLVILLGSVTVVVFVMINLFAFNRRVIAWRKRRFGYDPAANQYAIAQRMMIGLKMDPMALNPMSKNWQAPGILDEIAWRLQEAFYWDSSFVEKAETDPIFVELKAYGPYKTIVHRYHALRARHGAANDPGPPDSAVSAG